MKKAGFLQTGETDRGFLPAAVRCLQEETGAWNQEKTDSASPDAAGDSGVLVQGVPRAVSAEDTPFGTVPFDTGVKRLWQPKPVLLMKGAPLSFSYKAVSVCTYLITRHRGCQGDFLLFCMKMPQMGAETRNRADLQGRRGFLLAKRAAAVDTGNQKSYNKICMTVCGCDRGGRGMRTDSSLR